jgi:hypothetical protein
MNYIPGQNAVRHVTPTPLTFPIWRTVRRPEGANAEYYRSSYKRKQIGIDTDSERILDKVDWRAGPEEVDIARVAVRQLGFTEKARLESIYFNAFRSGLSTLPAWCPVQLRDEYIEQQNGERLASAMEAIRTREPIRAGYQRLFGIIRLNTEEMWLSDLPGEAGSEWHPSAVFLFGMPRG